MAKTLLITLILLSTIGARSARFELIKKVKLPADRFTVDIMGQVYWQQDERLIRYNPLNGQKQSYSNSFLGAIHSWDASNPLKTLVFHRDFNTLVFLDKNFGQIRSPINLDQLGVNRASACCISHQGGFWLVDPPSGQLLHFGPNLSIQHESAVISELTARQNHSPLIRESNKRIYCLVPNCCILIFDRFGNVLRRRPLKNVDNIQMLNQNIYYFYDGRLFAMNKALQGKKQVKLPPTNGKWDFARMGTQNMLYLLKNHQLYIFKT